MPGFHLPHAWDDEPATTPDDQVPFAPHPQALPQGVANAADFTDAAAREAQRGLVIGGRTLLKAGTELYRVGHSEGAPNYGSAWWMQRAELDRILHKGQRDTGWAARVMLAIAKAWGSDCRRQLYVKTVCDLYAWHGPGRPITARGDPTTVHDPAAHWFPEDGLAQLYIPGLTRSTGGEPLWRRVFSQCDSVPFLFAGTQTNLATGQAFSGIPLPSGRRPGSI